MSTATRHAITSMRGTLYLSSGRSCRNSSSHCESGNRHALRGRALRFFSSGSRGSLASTLVVLFFLLLAHGVCMAQAQRVVIIKVDGLPPDTVDRFVRERNERTGKSLLPWIEEVFYQKGTRVANFYVRGMSLSAPSWSLLDTGQHLQIKGNVEFDRFTLHSYDYLNFLPFYIKSAEQKRVDMPGAEVMDELGLPLLMDAFAHEERYPNFQLYQRGLRWTTLQRGAQNGFMRDPRELLDEWTVGFEARNIVFAQTERELIEKLQDPRIHYLDLYITEFDHAAHHNRDRETHLAALQDIDAVIGRIWTGIQQSPLADQTTLILLSDHGFNSDERVYSQGFNLVKLLGSREGGGHHVITKRRLMMDYSIKGIYPLVPLITTTTKDSYYLKGQSTDYPTALIDFDGNERSSIHLRDSALNVLHILLQQLQRKDLEAPLRSAMTRALFETLDARRAAWSAELAQLNEELGAFHRLIERQRALVSAQPKKWTREQTDKGLDKEAQRNSARLDSWREDERQYLAYARTLTNLLALKPEGFDPLRLRLEDVIAKGAMGDHNNIHQLQRYVVGPSPEGFILKPDGSLDMQRSFARVDYFKLLREATVRNNLQPGLDNHPVDFVSTRIPLESIAASLPPGERPTDDPLWLYAGPSEQALILAREDEEGKGLSLRYLPVRNLEQDAEGRVTFETAEWREGLPLRILEDQKLRLPDGAARAEWLGQWHTDLEWLRALHKTAYSNGLIGLHEQLIHHRVEPLLTDAPGLSQDERLMRRFRNRQRSLVEADLLVLANNHWNFDVRGFNPGGNHGSLFRISTHSTLMLAGGAATGVPHGFVVEEPYDSLSFVPTVLALTGRLKRDGRVPVPVLWERGFRPFPGRIIEEALGGPERSGPLTTPIARGH